MSVPQNPEKRWATRGSDIAEMLLLSEWDLDKLRITMTGATNVTRDAEPETRIASKLLLEFGKTPITKPYLLFLDQFADAIHEAIHDMPDLGRARKQLRTRYGPAPGQYEAARALTHVRRAVIWMEEE